MCVGEEASGGGIEIVSSLTLQNYSLDSLRLNPQRMTKALFFLSPSLPLPHSFSLMFSADKLLASHKQKKKKSGRDKARAANRWVASPRLPSLNLCFLTPRHSPADGD